MGRLLLVFRLVARDIQRSVGQSLMLLLAISTSAATLAMGLSLSTVGDHAYQQAKTATAGPDVVASLSGLRPGAPGSADLDGLHAMAAASGVSASTGPFPLAFPVLTTGRFTVPAMAEGRTAAQGALDRPEVLAGTWVRPGGIVLEQAFADALGVHPGDQVRLAGRRFQVAGIAASTGVSTYPFAANAAGGSPYAKPGLIWITTTDLAALSGRAPVSAYILDLKLADPATAASFSSAHTPENAEAPYLDLLTWQQIQAQDGLAVAKIQQGLVVGSWLLGLLAAVSITVLVGGRLADQNRRTGLLKAVGGTPALIAAVYLCQYLLLAALAAAAGLGVAHLLSPALTAPSAGLLGTAQPSALGSATIGIVFGVALFVAVSATLVPVNRAARASTISSLDDAARAPRRHSALIAFSARLPIPLLLGVRLAARRPRRLILNALSVAVTVCGVAAVQSARTRIAVTGRPAGGFSAVPDPSTTQLNQVMFTVTVMMVVLAVVNAVFISWATVIDSRRAAAVVRSLGASPRQTAFGVSAAQLLPAVPGAIAGIPAGIGLYAALRSGAGASSVTYPPAWSLATTLTGALLALTLLTLVPALIGVRRPVAEVLQAERA